MFPCVTVRSETDAAPPVVSLHARPCRTVVASIPREVRAMITPLAIWNARDRCRYLFLDEQAGTSAPEAERNSAVATLRLETAVSIDAT